ncbi:MAB_1171c family putative transporter [Streptomyces sp. NPDC050610]|uniref:MAB_1171c family putative transporter n=1 Tax=Streptomyces sp. NPDC050610 TaxID=3157097 RepID=UPI00343B09A6
MLWGVTIWRAPSALRSAKARALWIAFAAVTLAMTLRRPSVMQAVDHVLGINNFSTLVKNLLGAVGAGAVLDFVIAVARPETERHIRPRHIMVLVSIAAMSIAFAFTPRPVEVDDLFDHTAGTFWATVYFSVFQTYIAIAMAVAGYLFFDAARHADSRWLRISTRTLGTGTVVGVLYSLVRIAYLLLRLTGITDDSTIRLADYASNLTRSGAIGLILIGSSIPAIGVAWRQAQDYRSLRNLRPLWEDLTAAAPDIVLKTPLLRSPRIRLHRTVIEIRDASLALAPYADDTMRRRARAAAASSSHSDAAAEALWLRASREAKHEGLVPAGPASAPAGDSAPLDFEAEVTYLKDLAVFYRSPEAAEFVRTIRREYA